jgi:prevent-host-death family protein
MTEVASRELRNSTRALLARVDAGEEITITVDGRPVAALTPLPTRDRWMRREEFVTLLRGRQSDPGLRRDLHELAGETTDELPFR